MKTKCSTTIIGILSVLIDNFPITIALVLEVIYAIKGLRSENFLAFWVPALLSLGIIAMLLYLYRKAKNEELKQTFEALQRLPDVSDRQDS